jgi:hypothetical protein
MARTKSLTITATPQNIVVLTVCSTVLLKEDESVASWPTADLVINKGGGDADFITRGKSYSFVAPPGQMFRPGTILGTVAVGVGSTTAIQDEQ